MTTTTAQQVVLDNALVPLENRVEIGKFNLRIDLVKTQKEPTYHVFLDALALTTFYPAFLITADVPEIYMHQAQILWGMFYKKNVHFVELLWEDFTFQTENRDIKKQEKMYYARFTKAIIHHFITKDKSISMRNRMFMYTVEDDSILGLMRFKKTPAKAERSKGIDLQSEAALLEESQAKGKSVDTHEGTCLKPGVLDVSIVDSSESENESWGDSGYETNVQSDDKDYVHTPKDYVPTDDESNDVDVEEYERINEELYGDVNVRLTDDEPADEEKDDEEMTVVGHVNVNQKGAVSSIHLKLSQFLRNKQFLHLSTRFPSLQQSTPIPTPTTTEATTSTTVVPNSETLTALHQRITDLEKDVKELKDVVNSTKVISTIKS
ncbi:hypothetical protein Tco_1004487 [Tanacetum coccineum]|uniref:Uncharacterized protein n=1 Tax=Tanacetum coccineum TaxID=301880 RepID=A0ABQ5FD11_9ASTR